jgi:hypothetical protein
MLNVLGHFLTANNRRARGALPGVSRVCLQDYCSNRADSRNWRSVNHLKQTKLQKDARYHVNRSHNRRCSDHR